MFLIVVSITQIILILSLRTKSTYLMQVQPFILTLIGELSRHVQDLQVGDCCFYY